MVCSLVRCGAVRCGAVRCGAVRCGAAQHSAVWIVYNRYLVVANSIAWFHFVTYSRAKS